MNYKKKIQKNKQINDFMNECDYNNKIKNKN